ncbi:MAG: pilus assembly protein N-terminal domain-containing protein [Planctomycetota bacterium]|nr:pilus assembly protein N-terminal domain-containing protein [Planctomycetota bacterium]MDG2142890.1 pilus assembly protein N-terminal domain-containing protein [Planctomycetota bacterium]
MSWSHTFVALAITCLPLGAMYQEEEQESKAPAPEPEQSTKPADQDSIMVLRGNHQLLHLDAPTTRVAVGNPDVLSFEILDPTSVLLLGREVGRTSLLIWSTDSTPRHYSVSIEPDLSLLRETLTEIDPGVEVTSALDRDAIVLRGNVADLRTRIAIEAAARAWLDADDSSLSGESLGVLPTGSLSPTNDQAEVGSVISLLRIRELPPVLENRIGLAIQSAGIEGVRIERIQRGLQPDDSSDVFLLDGLVHNQVDLTRAVLIAASTISPDLAGSGIEVVADEAGGLRGLSGSDSSGSSGGQQFASSGQSSSVFQGGGQAGQIDNRISSNLGRATMVSAASGRILSILTVADLPQIQVDIQLYEIDRSRLGQLDVSLEAILSDFSQGPLSSLPSGLAGSPLVGSVSPTDAQGVLQMIDGSGAAGFQVAGSNAAVSATLKALESRGYARSLARPSITVLSGELAQFQVGGQIPVPTAFATSVGDGAEGVFNGVEFQPFGVRLLVRPLVEADGQITLDVVPEVVQPDTELTTAIRNATGTDPLTIGFESRALSTTARVGRNGALVIGGLLQQKAQTSSSGVPILSQLPGIGWLFGRQDEQSRNTELFIVVAPKRIQQPRPEARIWAHPNPIGLVLSSVNQGADLERKMENVPEDGNFGDSSGMSLIEAEDASLQFSSQTQHLTKP